MERTILRIGVVKSVRGRTIEVVVDKMKNVPHLLYNGSLIKNVSVGSYIKINKGFERIIGFIEAEEITEDKTEEKKNYKHETNKIVRVLKVKIVGFLERERFNQGVKDLPLIDNICYILTKEEYDRIHDFVDSDQDEPIKIGHLASELTKEINVGVNSLFASHIGIFGNTGSGKSYSLASIYNSLFEKFGGNTGFQEHSKFLLIDFNGEYIENEKGKDVIYDKKHKIVYDVPNQKIKLKKSTFEDVEILSLILDATDKTQKPFIKSCFNYTPFKKEYFNPQKFIKNLIDTLLSKKDKQFGTKAFIDLFNDLYDCVKNGIAVLEGKDLITKELGHYASGSYYSITVERDHTKNKSRETGSNIKFKVENLNHYFVNPLKEKVSSLEFKEDSLMIGFLLRLVLKYHYDIINGHANVEHISPLIRRAKTSLIKLDEMVDLQERPQFSNNLKIISLKNINDNSLKKVLALVVCKEAYDEQKKVEFATSYLNIIIDEAHNLLSYSSTRESETWKDYRLETFEEIIKEGRKFGTFLTIASQRPNDISQTIISQLHNYFLHRLINNKDIEAIEKTVSYLDKVSFESLSILPTGTCVLAGLATKLPVTIKINKLDEKYQPNSRTIKLTKIWKKEVNAEETPAATVVDKKSIGGSYKPTSSPKSFAGDGNGNDLPF